MLNQMYKKKYKLIIIIIMLTGSLNLFSQDSSAIGVYGGITQDGYGVLLNYNYYLNRIDFIQAGVYYSSAEDTLNTIEIPYNDFTIQVGYFTSLLTNKFERLRLNIGGGVLGGYEVVNNGDNTLDNGAIIISDSNFIYGAFGSLEIEYSLGKGDLSLMLKLNQYYHGNSDLGDFVGFAGAGLRYFLF